MKNITPKQDQFTGAESLRLSKLEKTIQTGVQQFMIVGAALSEIRDKRLYRAEFKTFEAYCQKRWDFSRQYASVLIRASDVAADLPKFCQVQLTNPTELNSLANLPKEERQAAAEKIIEAKKSQVKSKSEPEVQPAEPAPATDADIAAATAIDVHAGASITFDNSTIPETVREQGHVPEAPPEPEIPPVAAINNVQDALAFCRSTDEPGHNWEVAALILANEVERLIGVLKIAETMQEKDAASQGPLTPAKLLAELKKFKPRIPDTTPQYERAAFGEQINKMVVWLMNPVVKDTSAYTR